MSTDCQAVLVDWTVAAVPWRVAVPADKSIAQRALILSAMASGESVLRGALGGLDTRSTAAALAALGVESSRPGGTGPGDLRICGRGLASWSSPDGVLDLGNSGTGARLLAGAIAAQPISAVLVGDRSLSRRPMARIARPLGRMGAGVEYLDKAGRLPMRVTGGTLAPLAHESSVASAQVKSALLLAGVGAGVPIEVREPVRSRDHTERLLGAMGAAVAEGEADGGWRVRVPRPPSGLEPIELEIPGDFSSSAFLIAAWVLGRPGDVIEVRGVGVNPTRTGFLGVLSRMGAKVEVAERERRAGEAVGEVRVWAPSERLRPVEVGRDEVPALIDELPLVAVLAARAEGVTTITGAGELRVKESDRLEALARNLQGVGVAAEETPDGLVVEGTGRRLRGGVRSFGDHRIAMAFGALNADPGCSVEVLDGEVAEVSYPGFWRTLARMRSGDGGDSPARATAPEAGPELDAAAGHTLEARPDPDCLVVAIDGAAASGKSTTSREVAEFLGYRHLDSGALYRAVAAQLVADGMGESTLGEMTAEWVKGLAIQLLWEDGQMEVWSRGCRIAESERRDERVNAIVSQVAASPVVRDYLLPMQRTSATGPGLVAEGRDIGTVVFPDAAVKVFLQADPRVRATRRLLQRDARRPSEAEVEAEAAKLLLRDRRDTSRAAAPLRRASDAVLIDTTATSPSEQVQLIVELVRSARRS
ncbi:MAG: 3-phosphoshikimate 1-carboxyvinyltransferase [Gemmatimonadetes bacterium]|nr:3-phosphoshikimate 1-carboxyvinyltransferase [Gemmatimonadota bacterium]